MRRSTNSAVCRLSLTAALIGRGCLTSALANPSLHVTRPTFFEPQGAVPPGSNTPQWGMFYCLAPEAPIFSGMPMGSKHFWNRWACLSYGPALGLTLKMALSHARPFGRALNKQRNLLSVFDASGYAIDAAWRRCWGIPAFTFRGWPSSTVWELSRRLLPSTKGQGFIPWCLERHFFRGMPTWPKHFWSRRACLGYSSAPEPTLKKALYYIRSIFVLYSLGK